MKNNVLNKQQKIAKRYASAIAAFDNSVAILSELLTVSDVLEKSPDLKAFLENPIMQKDDKKAVLDEVFNTSLLAVTLNLLKLLVDKGRFAYFGSIICVLQTKIDEKNDVARVLVVSAVELTDDEKIKVSKKLGDKLKKTIEPDYEIDESVIAGLVIKIGDKVVDNSVRAKLEMMKRQLI